jgi:hypothetical protein
MAARVAGGGSSVEWYLTRDGQVWGPVALEQLKNALAEGSARPTDLVWKPGMAEWVAASDVAVLQPRVASPSKRAVAAQPAPRNIDASPAATADTKRGREPKRGDAHSARSNFIFKHWRGEFPLAAAHWVFGVLLTAAVLAGLYLVADSSVLQQLGQRAIGSYTITLAVVLLLVSAWQIVGVWRSAHRHVQAGKRHNWAGLAKVSVLFCALQLAIGSYSILALMAEEPAKKETDGKVISLQPMRLLAGGTEIEITGELTYGARYELARLFSASSKIKRVRFNSARIAESEEIAALLMQHSVATYGAGDCIGGCAIAFLAGAPRYLAKDARLGFHTTRSGNTDHDRHRDNMLRTALRSHGLPTWFIEKALTAPRDKIWFPKPSDLVSGGVIHGSGSAPNG